MNRYTAIYYHPAWGGGHWMQIKAESQEEAEKEAQRKLDDREPLGWRERVMERVPWEPGIKLVQVIYDWPINPEDEDTSEIPF